MTESPQRLPSLVEQLTAQFHVWERRGRGWDVWEEPIQLEPPFVPFVGHYVFSPPSSYDDGRAPGLWERIVGLFTGRGQTPPPVGHGILAQAEEEPGAILDDTGESVVELQVNLPDQLEGGRQLAEQLLLALSHGRHLLSFELVAEASRITLQMACRESDADQVAAQIGAHYPDVSTSRDAVMPRAWSRDGDAVIVDFGLSSQFMLPIRTMREFTIDPLVGFLGALENLQQGEVAVLQVLFHGTRNPWAESIFRAVMGSDGDCFFADAPQVEQLAKQKISFPLYSAVIRIGAKSFAEDRSWRIVKALGAGFRQFSRPDSNELIPLSNDGYPDAWHENDLLLRRSHRTGMLLSSDELVGFVHLPTDAVRSEKLQRQRRATRSAPALATGSSLVLGENIHRGVRTTVTLTPAQRVRHTYVVGASGTGKSTLLLNMIAQDIEQNHGLAVLDPHGDLIDDVLCRIPVSRAGDVVLIDPADADWPIGFNILSAHSEIEKTLLSSDLVAVFRRLSTSWGDQMTSVLGNAILAMLESERGGTMADLRRFLVDPAFRRQFLATVRDSEVVYYWQKEFPLLSGKPQAPLLTRLDTFLRPKLIRHMVCQKENRIDFASIMNDGKILLCKLAQGAVGEENAHLLGTLLVAKIHQIALSRQELAQSARRDFFLYLDEFHNFVTPSMAAILSGVRKYRLGLILAHQELRQLGSQDAEVLSAVLSNPCTRICFRVGDADAVKLASGFSSFNAQDLQRLGVGEAIARVERADCDFNLVTYPNPPADPDAEAIKQKIRDRCRSRYATPCEDVERLLKDQTEAAKPEAPPAELAKRTVTEQEIRQAPASPITPMPVISEPELVFPKVAPTSDEPAVIVPTPVSSEPLKRPGARSRPKTTVPAQLGKGGQQHRYLQELIKRLAEGLGYRTAIEQPVLGGQGQVDVVIEKEGVKVAFEISVTTDAGHEVGNIEKCLKAGFRQVAVVAPDDKRTGKIQEAATRQLDKTALERVRFMTPETLLAFIEELEAKASCSTQIVRGYKVKVKLRSAPQGEQQVKRRAISQVLGSAMRRWKD
jgi:hypothetical protein